MICIAIKFVYFFCYLLISKIFCLEPWIESRCSKKSQLAFPNLWTKNVWPLPFPRYCFFLSFLTLINKKQFCPKAKVTNIITENKSDPLYMVTDKQLLVQKRFLKTIKKQLTSADFVEFGNLIKIKHMWHVFNLVWRLKLQFQRNADLYFQTKFWFWNF